MASFEDWLTEKLKSLSPEFDTDVFVSYITSMLDTDSTAEEATESIEEILSQVLSEEESGAGCREIMEEWTKHSNKVLANANSTAKKDAGDMLSELMEHQTLATVKESKRSAEEQAHKRAILAQYAHVSDGEETDEEEEAAISSAQKGKESADPLMERNMNASSVMEAQQAQREQSKMEHERKKEKDKQDREAQRQKQQQRKEAEKKRTQKGERRR